MGMTVITRTEIQPHCPLGGKTLYRRDFTGLLFSELTTVWINVVCSTRVPALHTPVKYWLATLPVPTGVRQSSFVRTILSAETP